MYNKGLFTFMYCMCMYVCIVYLYVLYYNAITLCCRCTDEAQKASIPVSTAMIMDFILLYIISYRILNNAIIRIFR